MVGSRENAKENLLTISKTNVFYRAIYLDLTYARPE
jgi:hypothetical protein